MAAPLALLLQLNQVHLLVYQEVLAEVAVVGEEQVILEVQELQDKEIMVVQEHQRMTQQAVAAVVQELQGKMLTHR